MNAQQLRDRAPRWPFVATLFVALLAWVAQ